MILTDQIFIASPGCGNPGAFASHQPLPPPQTGASRVRIWDFWAVVSSGQSRTSFCAVASTLCDAAAALRARSARCSGVMVR
jgi:hypothetical protein